MDLSAAAGPAAEERQEDDQGGPKDRKTDGRGGRVGEGGNCGAGTSPAGALAHLPCCHTKGDTIRVGLKDGGERGRTKVFFSLPCVGVMCCHPRRPDMGSPERGVADGRVEGGKGEGGVRCHGHHPDGSE